MVLDIAYSNIELKTLKRGHFHASKDSVLSGGDFYINSSPNITTLNNYPMNVKEPAGNNLNRCFLLIESAIHKLANKDLPQHVIHFESELLILSNSLAKSNKDVKRNTIESKCILFIKLFDTSPIYSDLDSNSNKKWELAFSAKKMTGLVLCKNLIHSYRTLTAILDLRNRDKMKNYAWAIH